MFYRMLKAFTRFVLAQFYRRITVTGADLIEDGPVVVVANHNNSFVDPALIATRFSRRCRFMATALIFRFGAGWFLRRLGLVPVYRKDGGYDTKLNDSTFREGTKILENGGAIVIFPTKKNNERRILPQIATGFARFALPAEANKAFKLGVRIQPIGLNYGHLQEYRSSVTIVVGEAINLATPEWQARYEQDPRQAIAMLRDVVEQRLDSLVAQVKVQEYEALVNKIEQVFLPEIKNDHERVKTIAATVEKLAPLHPTYAFDVQTRIDDYLDGLQELKLAVGEEVNPRENWRSRLLLTPLVLIGVLLHFIPFIATRELVKRMPLSRYQAHTAKLQTGVVLFLAWYWLAWHMSSHLTQSTWLRIAGLATMLALEMLTHRWYPEIRAYLLSFEWPGRAMRMKRLAAEGQALRAELVRVANTGEIPTAT